MPKKDNIATLYNDVGLTQEEKTKVGRPNKNTIKGVPIPRDILNSLGFKLSPKEETFCFTYIETGNVGEALEKAGYNTKQKNYGYVLLKKERIQKFIEVVRSQVITKTVYSLEDTVRDLQYIKTLALEKNKLDTAVKCIELLGKTVGAFAEKHIHTGEVRHSIVQLPIKQDAEMGHYIAVENAEFKELDG